MKILTYLYIPGLFALIMGLVAGLVAQIWFPVPLSLILVGIALIGLWWQWGNGKKNNFWSKRSLEMSANTFLATLAVIIILGLINFLGLRYHTRIDFTENQLFTLSPQSVEVVQNLKKPIKVWIFQPELSSGEQELLANYRRQNPNFEFQLVDPQKEVALTQRFQVRYLGEVYLEYGDKKQFVQRISEGQPLSEAQLTNSIVKIQRTNQLIVYFLQGHGEPPLSDGEEGLLKALTALEDQGYLVNPLNLGEAKTIPKDANLIIIAGPKQKLFEGELKALSEYLKADGKLLVMIDPKTEPGLKNLLKEWGVELDERLMIDASGTGNVIGYGPATIIITNYGDHPITQAFGNNISVYPLSRAISTTPVEGTEAVALLITDPQTWAESNVEAERVEFNEGEDIPGPLDLGVALSRGKSRLVVFGNASFIKNGWIEQQLNEDVFLNTVEWLVADSDSVLNIRPKEPNNRRLELTNLQVSLISWSALLIVPLCGLIAAILAWWQRR